MRKKVSLDSTSSAPNTFYSPGRNRLDYFLGMLSAIPFSYPKEPLYWMALITLPIFFSRIRLDKHGMEKAYIVIIFSVLMLIVNIFSPYQSKIDIYSVFGGVFVISFFLAAYGIRDVEKFVDGFVLIIKVYVALTFYYFIVLAPYEWGLLFFVSSDLRMWADGYLPEWPNVYAVFLVMGMYIFWLRKNSRWFWLTMLAAIVTTSRMPLLAVSLIVFYQLILRVTLKKFIVFILVSIVFIYGYTLITDNEIFNEYLSNRLFKSGDRAMIFDELMGIYQRNLWGVGSLSFKYIGENYISYHSSFLKSLVRYGFLGLLLFILLVCPRKIMYKARSPYNLPILFLLLVGLFQDMLYHPHIIIMFSVFLLLRENHLLKVPR